MKNNFISIYATLSKKERRAFKTHYRTLYPRQTTAYALLQIVDRMDFSKDLDQQLDFSHIQKRLLKQLPTQANPNVSNTFSDLHLRLKEFLIFQAVKTNSDEFELIWINKLAELGLEHQASNRTINYQKKLEQEEQKDANLYFKKIQAYDLEFQSMYNYKYTTGVDNIRKCLKNLELFTLTSKLKFATELLNRKQLRMVDAEDELMYHFDENLLEKYEKEPIVHLYYYLYQLVKTNSEYHFEKLYHTLEENAAYLNKKDLYAMITYLLNFIFSYYKQIKLEIYEKVTNLYRIGFDNAAFEFANLSVDKLLNYIISLCKLQHYDKTKEVIKQFESHSELKIRSNFVALANAIVAFEEEDYTATIDYLSIVDFVDDRHKYRVKTLLIRSYYRTIPDDILFLLSQCRSLKRFAKKCKLHDRLKKSCDNFALFVEILVKKQISQEELLIRFENCKHLSFRHWLEKEISLYKKM